MPAVPLAPPPNAHRPGRLRVTRQLYFWVLLGIVAGIIVGGVAPGVAVQLQPLGDTFVNAIKMVITPIIFVTVVAGIAGVADLRGVGRIGGKAIIYFEAVTTIALVLGLVVMNLLKPGSGVHAALPKLSSTAADYVKQGEAQSPWHLLTDIVPSSVVGAFSEGDILQVLFFAVLFGIAVKALGEAGLARHR